MPYSAILFDLDGTLIATRRLYVTSYAKALAPFVGRELGADELVALRPGAERRFLKQMVSDDDFPACLEIFYQHYAGLHPTHFEGVYEGVPAMLEALREAGMQLGIVTGKSRRAFEITAPYAGLGAFETVIVDDDVEDPKPSPEGIRLALNALGVQPDRVLYIGDSSKDVEAALRARVVPAVPLWCKRPQEIGRFADRARSKGALVFETPEALTETVLAR